MFVKPAAGLQIPDPMSKRPIPAEGINVPDDSTYWLRRIKCGDVTKVEPELEAAPEINPE